MSFVEKTLELPQCEIHNTASHVHKHETHFLCFKCNIGIDWEKFPHVSYRPFIHGKIETIKRMMWSNE